MKVRSLIALMLPFLVAAQNNPPFNFDWEYRYLDNYPLKYKDPGGYSQAPYVETDGKGRLKWTRTKFYDENGHLIKFEKVNKRGKVKVQVNAHFGDYDEPDEIEIFHNGNMRRKTYYQRDEAGRPFSQGNIDKKGKKESRIEWKYNSSGCEESLTLYNRMGGLRKNYVHEYVDGCKKSRTTLYDKKGKGKKVWTFDCKSEGEELVKKKSTTQVCTWEEVSPGILTKVYQSFDEHGKIIRNVSTYTLEDTLILEWKQYDHKNQLRFHHVYDKSFERPLKQSVFIRGKEKYVFEYGYENGLVSYYSYIVKGKDITKEIFKYQSDGNLEEVMCYKSGRKLDYIIHVKYGG